MKGVGDVRGKLCSGLLSWYYEITHPLSIDLPLWVDIPTALLKAELLRRQDGGSEQPPACGSRHVRGSYNTPLHVGALILVLILSTLGMLFPTITL
jgi:hypothetical protein